MKLNNPLSVSNQLQLLLMIPIAFALSKDVQIMAKFTKNYFQYKEVRQIVIFGCWNPRERVDFTLYLDGFRTKYSSITKILNLETILKVNYYKLGVLLDMECFNSNSILDLCNDAKIPYNESYFWLMRTKNKEHSLSVLKNLPLGVNAEMTLALENSQEFELYDIYNPSYRHGGRLNATLIGHWQEIKGLKVEQTQYKYNRRANFHGLSLNFSIVLLHEPKPDFKTYMTTPINKRLDNINRFYYNFFIHLRDYYNLTMHLTRKSTWGYRLTNGSFDGILGDMIEGIVDVSVSPFMFKQERLDVIDYTVQAYLIQSLTIFRRPKSNNIRNNFLKPFRENVWWLIIAAMIMYWGVLYATKRFELFFQKGSERRKNNAAVKCALTVLAAISQQGFARDPRLYSGRIVFISLYMWSMMLFQFYSASIVGSLLSESPQYINNIDDLIHSNFEFGMEDMVYNRDYMRKSTDPKVQRLYAQKMAPNKKRKTANFFSAEEGFQRVREGGFAFTTDSETAYNMIDKTFTDDEICELAEISIFPPHHLSAVIVKHSPFKKMVIYGLRKIIEHGVVDRLEHRWMHKRPECPKSVSYAPTSVPITEFSPLLVFLFIGFCLATCIIGLEKVFYKF